jgi:subtilisin family serine protease
MSKKSGHKDSSKVWGIFSLLAAVVAAAAARKALNASWRAATGKPPPANPASPDVDMREALAWAAVSGTIIAVARMLATRRAAHYYARSTGHLPPGVADDA